MARVYVGLDLGSSSCHWRGKNAEGVVVIDRKFPTGAAELAKVAEETPGEAYVHLEASELAGWARTVLKGRVAGILVSDPKRNAWIAKDPQKDDPVDADKLSDLLRLGIAQKHEVYYSDQEDRGIFKQMVQHYDRVTRQEARLKQQIKAAFRVQGVIPKGSKVYTSDGRQEYLRRVRSEVAREAIGQLYTLLDHMIETQTSALKLLRREGKRYEEIERFDDVPGIGEVGAFRFFGYVQTPHRFSSKRKLWRYSRLGVTRRKSDGKPLEHESLDWNGVGALKDVSRKAFEGALRAHGDNMFKRAYRKTLQRTHNETHARLSTQRKILSVLRALWIGGTRYQDDKG